MRKNFHKVLLCSKDAKNSVLCIVNKKNNGKKEKQNPRQLCMDMVHEDREHGPFVRLGDIR